MLASRLALSALMLAEAVIESIDEGRGGVFMAPVRPTISLVSSGWSIRLRFFGGDRTWGKHWLPNILVLFVKGVDLMGLLRDCRTGPAAFEVEDDAVGGAVKGSPSMA